MPAAKKAFVPSVTRNLEKDLAAAEILKAQLKDMYGEETDIDLVKDMIEGETGLFEAVDGVLQQIGVDLAGAEAIAEFTKKLGARKKRLENRVETMRTMLLNAMDVLGETKFERPIATLTVKPVPPSLTVSDEAAVPTVYWSQPDPVLDRKKLTDALKLMRDTLAEKLDELSAKLASGEMDQASFDEMRERLTAAFPPIPGAELGNGGTTIQIRFI